MTRIKATVEKVHETQKNHGARLNVIDGRLAIIEKHTGLVKATMSDVRNRLEPAEKMPTVEEVRAWRASMTRGFERGITVSWSGAGWQRIHRMVEAENRYKERGLL